MSKREFKIDKYNFVISYFEDELLIESFNDINAFTALTISLISNKSIKESEAERIINEKYLELVSNAKVVLEENLQFYKHFNINFDNKVRFSDNITVDPFKIGYLKEREVRFVISLK